MMQQYPQAVVLQPQYVTQPYLTASVVNSYRSRQSAVIGILLTIIGSLSIIFNIIDLAVGTDKRWNQYSYVYWYPYATSLSEESNGVAGHGIWGGITMIIAGGFGIGAARQKTRCMINAFLALAIIGAVVTGIQACIASTGASRVFQEYERAIDYYSEVAAVFTMEILLAVAGGCGFLLCLWGSILGCATGDCCGPIQPTAFTMMSVGQPQVTVLTQHQQYPAQHVAMAQPPPYQQAMVFGQTPPQYQAYQTDETK